MENLQFLQVTKINQSGLLLKYVKNSLLIIYQHIAIETPNPEKSFAGEFLYLPV
jgi:hypothetical protein